MLERLCVAYVPTPRGDHAVRHAAMLARRARVPLTVMHAMPHTDDPGHEQPTIADELLGRREDVTVRRRLATALLGLTAGVETDLRVFKGPPAEALRALRPGVVVAGGAFDAAGCPVVIVRSAPARAAPLVLALTAPDPARDRALAAARELAEELGAGLLHHPAPRDVHDDAALLAAAAAGRRHAPLLTVVTGERWHRMRRRIGRSPVQALLAAAVSPLLVMPRQRDRRAARPAAAAALTLASSAKGRSDGGRRA